MARPRYAEMLVDRRRQLGLSISQASQVLRLKEQVLIAFEEGDFDSIPKSGYAQGMLSSYARYLGLNSREVVSQFSSDLYEYADERRRELRLGGTGAIRAFTGTDAGPYVESRGLLPTSGGLAGDMGAFSTTSQPHSRSQATPLVGQRRYVGTAGRSTESAMDGMLDSQYAEDRAYGSRGSGRSYSSSTGAARARRTRTSGAYGRDEVRVSSADYADDYYEPDYAPEAEPARQPRATSARPARQARSERGSSRNSNRRSSSSRRRSGSSQQTPPSRTGGLVGNIASSLGPNSGRIALVVVLLLALLLTGIIIFSVRSCASDTSVSTTDDKTVPVASADETTDDKSKDNASKTSDSKDDKDAKDTDAEADAEKDSEETTDADKDKDSEESTTKKTTAAKETKVTVSVESGAVSWVDIQVDGESKVADTLTGPWSETYEVHQSIVIEAGDTTAVTVTENGVRRQFDSKTSGLGTLTIEGTPEQKTETTTQTTGGETQQTGEGTTETTGEATDETTTEAAPTTETQTTQEGGATDLATEPNPDEYYSEYNGYTIYYNSENDLYYFFDENGVRRNAANGQEV